MKDLPELRVDFRRPFKNTGVDYFGPLNVMARRLSAKKWLCLMTCLTTRVVHLEVALVDRSSVESFVSVYCAKRQTRSHHQRQVNKLCGYQLSPERSDEGMENRRNNGQEINRVQVQPCRCSTLWRSLGKTCEKFQEINV